MNRITQGIDNVMSQIFMFYLFLLCANVSVKVIGRLKEVKKDHLNNNKKIVYYSNLVFFFILQLLVAIFESTDYRHALPLTNVVHS